MSLRPHGFRFGGRDGEGRGARLRPGTQDPRDAELARAMAHHLAVEVPKDLQRGWAQSAAVRPVRGPSGEAGFALDQWRLVQI